VIITTLSVQFGKDNLMYDMRLSCR